MTSVCGSKIGGLCGLPWDESVIEAQRCPPLVGALAVGVWTHPGPKLPHSWALSRSTTVATASPLGSNWSKVAVVVPSWAATLGGTGSTPATTRAPWGGSGVAVVVAEGASAVAAIPLHWEGGDAVRWELVVSCRKVAEGIVLVLEWGRQATENNTVAHHDQGAAKQVAPRDHTTFTRAIGKNNVPCCHGRRPTTRPTFAGHSNTPGRSLVDPQPRTLHHRNGPPPPPRRRCRPANGRRWLHVDAGVDAPRVSLPCGCLWCGLG